MTQWDFQNKGTRTSPALLSIGLEVPVRHLRPSVIYSVPRDRILDGKGLLPSGNPVRLMTEQVKTGVS